MQREIFNGRRDGVKRIFGTLRHFVGLNKVYEYGDILLVSTKNNEDYDLILLPDGKTRFVQLYNAHKDDPMPPTPGGGGETPVVATEMFDISAYHATGTPPVPATYADLTAALGTDGENVPDALRKGGMSIKFIQSSDNKYVQYRLMSTTWSTVVTDWQGVDNEPTVESDNLVNSGGVAQNIKPTIFEGTDDAYSWIRIDYSAPIQQGSIIVNNGVSVYIYKDGDTSTYITLNNNESYKCEWPVGRIRIGENSGDYHVEVYKANTISAKVKEIELSGFITKSVNDLTNYYLKSETYTKAEVAALIGAIQQFHYEIYASSSEVTTPANNVLYLIGPASISGSDKYEEYVYANNDFVKIGDTSIDLSGYVTTTALNTALADYTTTANLTALLSGKVDKVTNATSGNLAGLDANGNLTDSGIEANEVVTSTSVRTIVLLTQAQYDALTTKDVNTEYNIIESV